MAKSGLDVLLATRPIEETNTSRRRLVVQTAGGKERSLACHGIHFKPRLAIETRIFDPVHFQSVLAMDVTTWTPP